MNRFGFGLGFNVKSVLSLIEQISLWFDNGTGAINEPWNDLDTWSE